MKIFFSIQTHFWNEYVGELVRYLSSQGDYVALNCDFEPTAGAKACRNENVSVVQSLPTIWCGPSQIIGLHRQIQHAVQMERRWDYFINLSGDSVPLQDISYLRAFLTSALVRNSHFFVSDWKVAKSIFRVPTSENSSTELIPIRGHYRNLVHCEESAQAILLDPVRAPLKRIEARFSLKCLERLNPKRLEVFGTSDAEFDIRQKLERDYGLYGSRAYFAISRSGCKEVLERTNGRDHLLFDTFKTSFEPDESWLPTLINRIVLETDMAKTTNSVHFLGGQASRIRAENLQEVCSSGAYFARKVDFDLGKKLIRSFTSNYLNSSI